MEKLIEALQIFLKYKNVQFPTYCSHDKLTIMAVEKNEVSDEDIKRLEELLFTWSDEDEAFTSTWYGSA